MIDYDNVFHIGIIVPEIEAGMAEIGKRFGVTWPRPPSAGEVSVRTEAGTAAASVVTVYTAEGPPYLELLQGVPGTVWEAGPGSRIHHIGAFVDDLDDEVARLTAEGAQLEATLDLQGGLLAVAYMNSDLGVRLELLPSTMRENIIRRTAPEGA